MKCSPPSLLSVHDVPLSATEKASNFSHDLNDSLMEYSVGLLNFTQEPLVLPISIQSRELWVIFSNVPADWCRMAGVICCHHLPMKQERKKSQSSSRAFTKDKRQEKRNETYSSLSPYFSFLSRLEGHCV